MFVLDFFIRGLGCLMLLFLVCLWCCLCLLIKGVLGLLMKVSCLRLFAVMVDYFVCLFVRVRVVVWAFGF